VREQQPRLSEQVERGVGQRDVLLDHRAVAAPLRQPLSEDQRAVAEAKHVLEVGRTGRARRGHRRQSHRVPARTGTTTPFPVVSLLGIVVTCG